LLARLVGHAAYFWTLADTAKEFLASTVAGWWITAAALVTEASAQFSSTVLLEASLVDTASCLVDTLVVLCAGDN
jgi:hypothetical protein